MKIIRGLINKFKFLPSPVYVKNYYQYYTGKKLDLNNPKEFNQKIQWLKVYYKNPILTQLVDKYAVRPYVEEKIGKQYLNELLAVYYKASEVDFASLPSSFVLKGAHGYNFNLIVRDKRELNIRKAKFLLHKWMSKNQYYRGGKEWAYKNVKPKLIAEKFLNEIGKNAINDYKFYCFNGMPKFVQVDIERGSGDLKCFYDLNWIKLPFNKGKGKLVEGIVQKPKNFDNMVSLATKLAIDFPFVRVDFYNIEGRIIFGELTFYPGDGRIDFLPDEFNSIIGEYLTLPKIPKGQKYITTF